MKILLDTHIFLWALAEPKRLGATRQAELELLSNIVFVSAISIAEIMIKSSLRKLRIDFDPVEVAGETGFEVLSFDAGAAVLLKDLPFHHRDPFDRMLIAQAFQHNYLIMTDDVKFQLYDCRLI